MTDIQKGKGPRIRFTEDGLHLDGSILWFDSKPSGDLTFLSSVTNEVPRSGPQVIATEETIRMLEVQQKKTKALVCQYNKPFSIGRLKMELLPSGSILGGASLHVETGDKKRILYAPHLLSKKNNTVRQMQLKEANILILGVAHPDPNASMPSRKKEKERLVKSVQRYVDQGIYPVIYCKPFPTAQEITNLLSDHSIPLAVHQTIFKFNRIYEHYGSELGSFQLYKGKKGRQKTTLMPHLNSRRQRHPIPDGPVLYIEDTLTESPPPTGVFNSIEDRFYISSSVDGTELREIIQAVNPEEVYLFGPYAKRYLDQLTDLALDVKPLYRNDQPPLF